MVKISKGCLAPNVPSEDVYVTKTHPLSVKITSDEDDKDFEDHLDETFEVMLAKVCHPDLIEHYRKKCLNGRPFLYPEKSDQVSALSR